VKYYREPSESRSRDYSGVGILLGNAFVIACALVEGWDLGVMMAIYWAQSVIIGGFHFFRILLLRSFSTEGFTSNGSRVPETEGGKRGTALFFAVHYGIFHLVYAVFLLVPAAGVLGGARVAFLLSVLGFLLGHAYSFYQNVRADLARRPNLGTMMFLPYARILPMHLTILFGSVTGSHLVSLLLFSGLKTAADYIMHIVEHRVLQGKAKAG